MFFYHVSRIIRHKNEVPRPKGVPCSPFTDGQTDRVTTEGTISGFQDFFLKPFIKDWPNLGSQNENVCKICKFSQLNKFQIDLYSTS